MSKIGIQQIFKQKLKVGNFHCLHSNINIVQNFGHLQNKCVIYRPGIYNLQTRTVTFPDQEKLLEKIDLRYLKTLKTKKLNTKKLHIKHCPCSKFENIQTRFLQFTDQKK